MLAEGGAAAPAACSSGGGAALGIDVSAAEDAQMSPVGPLTVPQTAGRSGAHSPDFSLAPRQGPEGAAAPLANRSPPDADPRPSGHARSLSADASAVESAGSPEGLGAGRRCSLGEASHRSRSAPTSPPVRAGSPRAPAAAAGPEAAGAAALDSPPRIAEAGRGPAPRTPQREGRPRKHAEPIVLAPDPLPPPPVADEVSGRVSAVMQMQRWFPVIGWGKKRLPTDPPEWVDAQGQPRPRDLIQPPPRCRWTGDWVVDAAGMADPEGWEYAGDWWWKHHSPMRTGDCVRRRKWLREWEAIATSVAGVVDHPGEDFVLAAGDGEAFGLELSCMRLSRVEDNSPADRAGLDRCLGRRLVQVNGVAVSSEAEVAEQALGRAEVHLRFEPAPAAPPPSATPGLHRLFPGLDPDERAIENFQCNYASGNFHRVGRMYITPKRVCFHSVMCDPIVVSYDDFAKVEKKSTWGFLDGIHIHLREGAARDGRKETLQFTAFLNRDQAYVLLQQLFTVHRRAVGGQSESADSLPVPAPSTPAQAAAAAGAAADRSPHAAPYSGSSLAAACGRALPPSPEVPPSDPPAGDGLPTPRPSPRGTPRAAAEGQLQCGPAEGQLQCGGSGPSPASDGSACEERESSPTTRTGSDAGDSEPGDDARPRPPQSAAAAQLPGGPPAQAMGAPVTAAPLFRRRGPHTVVSAGRPGEPGARVRQGAALDSPLVRHLPHGCLVEVAEVRGRRARITHPCDGWVSVVTRDGAPILIAAKPRTVTDGHTLGKEAKYAELRRLFPALADDARLVDDFQCSYKAKNKIDRLGRMWITQTAVCFASPLLSPPLTIPFQEVADITKKSDLWLLSAIEVLTAHDSYVFTAFIHRDQAWMLMRDLWLQHHKKQGRDPEGLGREARRRQEERERERERERAKRKQQKGEAARALSGPALLPAVASEEEDAGGAGDEPAAAPELQPAPVPPAEAGSLFAGSRLSAHFCDEGAILATAPFYPPTPLPRGATLPFVFDTLIRDPAFLDEVKARHGEYAGPRDAPQRLSLPPWEGVGPSAGEREVCCTTVVSAPWSVHTRFIERQRYAVVAGPPRAILLHTVGQTPDVMTGDCFRVENTIVFSETAPGGDCQVRGHGLVTFLKGTWLKSKIQNTALGELAASYVRDFEKPAAAALRQRLRRAASASAAAPEPNEEEEEVPPPAPRAAPPKGWGEAAGAALRSAVGALAGASGATAAGAAAAVLSLWLLWGLSAAAAEQRRAAASLAELSEALAAVVGADGGAEPPAARLPEALGASGAQSLAAAVQGQVALGAASAQLAAAVWMCFLCGAALAAALLLRR